MQIKIEAFTAVDKSRRERENTFNGEQGRVNAPRNASTRVANATQLAI